MAEDSWKITISGEKNTIMMILGMFFRSRIENPPICLLSATKDEINLSILEPYKRSNDRMIKGIAKFDASQKAQSMSIVKRDIVSETNSFVL